MSRRKPNLANFHENGVMKDGLYQVTRGFMCAGFSIVEGRLEMIAPALRERYAKWKVEAIRVAD